MIDIHSHILPGIDDGSRDIAESVEIVRQLVDQGVTDVIATPHYVDETNYICGFNLDVDTLVYDEVLIELPYQVLCSEDCKGLCKVCGQDLNSGSCQCDQQVLDPRMAVIRDIFNNFKEV